MLFSVIFSERKGIMMTISGVETDFRAAGRYARKDWMQNEDVAAFKKELLSAMEGTRIKRLHTAIWQKTASLTITG